MADRTEKKTIAGPHYEYLPPKVIRIGENYQGAGAFPCESGSGANASCTTGNTAQTTCDTAGNSALGSCDPSGNLVGA